MEVQKNIFFAKENCTLLPAKEKGDSWKIISTNPVMALSQTAPNVVHQNKENKGSEVS